MKTNLLRFLRSGLLLAAACSLLARAQADPASKVRVLVSENNIEAPLGGSAAATPAPPPAAGQGGKKAAAPAASANFLADMQAYTHTARKSLTIQVMNVTNEPIDVTVKANFLGKDEAGKHDIVTESTLEKKLTLQPGQPQKYTTDEVAFTHTTAHRGPAPKGGAGMHGKPAPMEPASGHNYFGYKVEVVQGSNVVGSAVSENH
jgi:hypothetical protein